MNIFKQRKNKRFNYTPRHLRENAADDKDGLASQWQSVRQSSKSRGKKFISLPLLLLFLGMIIVLWMVLNTYIK